MQILEKNVSSHRESIQKRKKEFGLNIADSNNRCKNIRALNINND
jgi:hypothetical protein